MAHPHFAARLREASERSGSLLCLGLDPTGCAGAAEAERFCAALLDAVLDQVCAVKPNAAFFEQHGSAGWKVLEGIRGRVPADRMLIVDGKRGDIGSTAEAYARALFDGLGADAVTVNPLMGEDAVRPFLTRPGRGAFLLARTSNPGAADLLERRLDDGTPVYAHLAALATSWDPGGAVGLVAGATSPAAVAALRRLAPSAPLLIPGVGAQGGAVEEAVAAGLDAAGAGVVVSVSRGIASAPEGPAAAARHWRERIAAGLARR
ncbi:MAG TPA: orotidine-5'-phosphate decarboxylase [Candidatus Dormibacteraeota bacterium]|nr:orotidine-5'-phosphate decarboxylase [Candidatus Dormibacteraeota bacterium]